MNQTVQERTGAPLPIPSDFPVSWANPADAQRLWMRDQLHNPEPVTPLSADFISAEQGLNLAAEHYSLPVRAAMRRINGFIYLSISPSVLPEEMEAQGKIAEQRLAAAMGRLQEIWQSELLPAVQGLLHTWDAFDLRHAGLPELLAHLDETARMTTRLWEIHFLIGFPFLLAPSLFADCYRTVVGAQDGGEAASELAAYRLLQGFDNKTLESNRALWRLSQQARGVPLVRDLLQEKAAGEVIEALRASAEGRRFLGALFAYLEEYGQRGRRFTDISTPSWIEDPLPAVICLKDYLVQPDQDPEATAAALAREREQLVAEARAHLQERREAAEQFEFLLRAAQQATTLREDHAFWIDQRGLYRVRRVVLVIGKRLAAGGAIEAPADVFYLELAELRDATLREGDWRPLVAARKAEMERFREVQPPPLLGSLPPVPPGDTPIERMQARVFGAPPQPAEQPDVIKGLSGSAGTARGRARVVHSLDEADALEPGDVLVAPSTTPPWTVLFATAAAVVTDAGGALSHCALVAREYQIPAVVGTGIATAVIKDGQIIEVDGDAGVVRLISAEGLRQ